MNVHFIAIGGSVMHNLALELQSLGYAVTGSDDAIHNPARDRLQAAGLLPEAEGWFPERISENLDAVILGMHARRDNPELLRALETGVEVWSFPEFIYRHARQKQRLVVAGSHGKTTITSMLMHVLGRLGYDFDYLVGAKVEGFEKNVRLTKDAPLMVIEGDEYHASALDPRPKCLVFQPHIAIVSGISWDHINVFPTEQDYIYSFEQLLQALPKAGMCVFNKEDKLVKELAHRHLIKEFHLPYPYQTPPYRVNRQGEMEVKIEGRRFPVSVIGRHNASNIGAAWEAARLLAVSPEEFSREIATFRGAHMRMQKVYEDDQTIIIRDFAHAPSKVSATVEAVAELYKDRNIIACLELHTFSSLNKEYIARYRNTMKRIKNKLVLVSNQTLKLKKSKPLTATEIRRAFHDRGVKLVGSRGELQKSIRGMLKRKDVILLMSSGNLDGLDIRELVQ